MTKQQQDVLIRYGAADFSVPLILDSPHSGTFCPPDMRASASTAEIMTSCDAFVDELWRGAVSEGAVLLAANFHRSYIDPNRSRTDIDETLLAEPWPQALDPTDYTRRGLGLIRRYALPGVPMYGRKLTVAEVEARLLQYYDVYHAALRGLLDDAHARFEQLWHVNCHSMKSVGNAMNIDNGGVRPDMVVSDRHGTTANATFTHWVAGTLRAFGYHVTINSPYSGGDIVRKYGKPENGYQSIQIEINRQLYMDEKTLKRNQGFSDLQKDLNVFTSQLVTYIRAQLNTPITVGGH